MLISRVKVAGYLKRFLIPEDKKKHFNLITDLSWAATLVLELGFQCPKNEQEETKKKFFALVQKLSEARTRAKVRVKMSYYYHNPVFPLGRQPTLGDVAIVCDLFHLAVQKKRISKEKMLKWLQEAWDAGTVQQKICSMEMEGSIMNELVIVTNFGAKLALFGSRNGLLPN